jgi:hypothetical protein
MLFALFLIYVAGSILFRDEPQVRAVLYTLIIMWRQAWCESGCRLLGKRWEKQYRIEQTYREQLRAPMAPDYEI